MTLLESVVLLFEKNRGTWISDKRIVEEAGLEERGEGQLAAALKELESSGYLIKKRRAYLRERPERFVVGTFSALKGGGGFVIPRGGGCSGDIFVPSARSRGAMNGDTVICAIRKAGVRKEGEVALVVKRKRDLVVGILSGGYLLPFGGGPALQAPAGNSRDGALAIAGLEESPGEEPKAGRIEFIGDPFDTGAAIKAVERIFGLDRPFSKEAEDEAGRFGNSAKKEWTEGRRDFRALPTITIDPTDAKDFDDAISVEKNRDGGWRLFVHIADVSFFVKEGGRLDLEARERGNSVYLPGKVYPMLPHSLSDGLCSLKEAEERLCLTCEMSVHPSGKVTRALFFESVIRSEKRLSYEEAESVISGEKSFGPKVDGVILAGHDLASLLSAKRAERGALDFDLPEPRLDLSPGGTLERIFPSPRLRSHRLIEEFMLLANAETAEFLRRKKQPFIYRVHEEPDEEKMKAILPLLNSLSIGASFKPRGTTSAVLGRAIEAAKGKPFERLVSYQILRAMMRARYSEQEGSHYGLALDRYCHFTSPIRRYPDLVVHRSVKAALCGTTLRNGDLSEIAARSTESERLADEAEREAVGWMTLIYLQKKLGEDFRAMITGFTKFGVKIELMEELIEGVCPFSFMEGDEYTIDRSGFSAKGRYTSRTFRVGQAVTVKLAKVDLFNREAQFALS